MKQKGVVIAVLLGLFVLAAAVGFQPYAFSQEATEEGVAASVKVGNKICPVSNEPIDEMAAVEVEYNGKIYNLCCEACKKDFQADPEKYIKIIEEQQASEVTDDMGAPVEPGQ